MGDVGSWFCNSSTSRLRNVVPVVVLARPAPVEDVVEELLPDEAEAALVFGVKRSTAEDDWDRPIGIAFIIPPEFAAKVF
jgi:hypothetical protein